MQKPFDEVFEDRTKYGTKIKTDDYHNSGTHIIIDQGQEYIAGYTDLEKGLFTEVPAIIFGDHTRIIKYVDRPFFLGADGVKVLRCKYEDANYKYLYYALKSVRIPNTGYNRHFKWLKEATIFYPDKNVQEKIVEVLEKASVIINKRQQQLSALDDLIKARFVEMFGDTILNPLGWDKALLGTVCDVRDGTHDSPQYFEKGFPLVTSKNVTRGKLDLTGCSLICEADYKKINERSKVDMGDIIMPMIGTVGKPVIVDIEPHFAIKNVSLIKFRSDSKVLNTYIHALLQSDYFDEAVINKVRGGTQKFISLGDIRKLEILVPSMEKQQQFVSDVSQINKSKSVIQKSLDETKLLFESLMQQYFG